MVLILPLISNSPCFFSKPLSILLRVPTTLGITVIFSFHSFFQLSSKIQVLSLFCSLWVSHTSISWSQGDSKCPQVSWTLLCILADQNNAVVRMVWILLLIFNSFRPLSKPLRTVSRMPTTIGFTVTNMFRGYFFSSWARSKYLLSFIQWSARKAKSTWRQLFFPINQTLVVFWLGLHGEFNKFPDFFFTGI